MKKSYWIVIAVILLSLATGTYFYPQLPNPIAFHWNAQGQVDSYIPKFWGLLLIPFVSLGLFLLFILIPKIDPLEANIEKFRKYFDAFVVLIIIFLFYIYLLTIFWNLDLKFNMGQPMAPALGILLYYCGVLLENAKRNWFIGIRTPWTLSSSKVWEKTHKVGGKLFKLTGLIAFGGIIFPNYVFLFVVFSAVAITVYTIAYSYFEYHQEMNRFLDITRSNRKGNGNS